MVVLAALAALALLVTAASGEAPARPGAAFAGRTVRAVRVTGLETVSEQLVRNQIRMQAGAPYDPKTVESDIVRITNLGRFDTARARIEPQADGSVILTYVLEEQPLLDDVRVVGNKHISDQKLLSAAGLRPGDPVDRFLVDRAKRRIEKRYAKRGFFVAEATVEKSVLEQEQVLIFRVREGPRVRIEAIRFEGNERFRDEKLRSEIESSTHLWLIRSGTLSRERIDRDVARLRELYRKRGHLDAEVGREIDLSPDQQRAVVRFIVKEGDRYHVDELTVEGNQILDRAQIVEASRLRPGTPFSSKRQKETGEAIRTLYGKIGFLKTDIRIERVFHEEDPLVDVEIRIEEGEPFRVGRVLVRGNDQTQDRVILRQLRGLKPGRRFDRAGIEETEKRLGESSLFREAAVTLSEPRGDDASRRRDVVVEVEEDSTGSISLGAGVSSDLGVIGSLNLTQRNFDITDTPESAGELFTGKAFRGAGQFFSLNLQPGDERSNYQFQFREPALLHSDLFFSTSGFVFSQIREDWEEARTGGSIGLGKNFSDVWSAKVTARAEEIEITDIDPGSPEDVFDVRGTNFLTSLKLNVTRNTTDSRIFPTSGSLLEVGVERVGAAGGDFDFTRLTAEYRKFWTVAEDFLGRETVLSFRGELGYIPEGQRESPTFERFFAGGQRSFRGFDFRGVGPRGIKNNSGNVGDDPVGGAWMTLAGIQYNFPLYKELLRGVLFADTGTVQRDVGFGKYRVAVGGGFRIQLPFLGRAPFALDFAAPVSKEEGDEERLISFDLSVPF